MPDAAFAVVQPLSRQLAGPGFAAAAPIAGGSIVHRVGSDPRFAAEEFVLTVGGSPARTVRYRGAAWQSGQHLGFAVAEAGQLLLLAETAASAEATVAIAGVADSYFGLLPGTPIDTPGGPLPVETLGQESRILLADGAGDEMAGVVRIAVSPLFADPLRACPVRIGAGALGGGLPTADLLVSPDLALRLDGRLIQAGALVDGRAIRREAWWPDAYWRVRLARPGLARALGVAVEAIQAGAAAEEGAAADYPRATSHRQVPYAIRARLAAG